MRQPATSSPPKRAGAPVDPWWVLTMVRRGWRTLAMAGLGGLVVGGILAVFVVPSEWESEAVLVSDVETDPANPWAQQDTLSEGAQLLEHPSTLAAVRDRLAIPGTIDALDRRIDAEADRQAGVIRVRGRSASASGAAGLTNVVVDTFLEQRRASEGERLTEHARVRRAELEAAQHHLAEARREYDQFRSENGIADLTAEQEAAITEAARLSAEADEEEVAALTAEARMTVLRTEARRLPRMHTASASSTDLVQGELAQARAELAAARARYTAEHPAVQSLEARIAGLEAQRRTGGRSAVTTDATSAVNPVREALEGNVALAAADRATSVERTEGLRRLAERARERVRALSELEGQASLLLAAVNVGSRQVDELRADIAQAEDRAGDPPAGFHVAAAAVAPERALSSKAAKIAWVLPPLLSLMIAFGLLFFRERGGPRARTAVEVAWWGNAPVIGTTTWPRDPEALDLLVAELEDLGTYAAGRTLVVPATPEERDLATEFAARLAEAPWLAAGVLDVEDETSRSEPPPRITSGEVTIPGHRPTLPMPIVVPPAPADGHGPHAVLTSSTEHGAGRVRRATVRLMMADAELEAIAAADARAIDPESGRITLVGHDGDELRPRRITGRFTLGAPTVLVGPDVRAASTVKVGDRQSTSSPLMASAAMLTPAPLAVDDESRSIHVSGTVDDGQGTPVPFDVRAEAPTKQDAVLMLAMRILGDGSDGDAETARPTIIDPRAPAHRAVDPRESRARNEQAVALAWNGPMVGPTLRRAARLADRVIVLVRDGTLSPADLAQLQVRLGREDAIGFLVVGSDEDDANRRDRVGKVAEFWTTRKRLPG